ncbi:MAG TPA: cytochrome c [Acidobacteriaceae bacterium]|nr:cytochrome c [Acidobacteriaceae bacterium]
MRIRTAVITAAVVAATTITPAFAQGSGADTYKSKCAMCHGADGLASGPAGKAMKVPPITDIKGSEAELIATTKSGKGKMPAYAGKLSDGQIKDVVSYMLTLKK